MNALRWAGRCLAWVVAIAAAWTIVLTVFAAGMWAAWSMWGGE